jgi:glycerol-1-phosphate dehydrogenase [NAD(P)+]
MWLAAGADGQVHTDWGRIGTVRAALQPGMAVLSVGSGTVTDVAKHAAFVFGQEAGGALPLVTYATANSVSAYASNMAPVFVDGVKRTLPSRYPDVLVCDLETLRDAPAEMTVAGVGDLLAAGNSYADWYLAQRLGLDTVPGYTEFARTLMGPLDEIFLDQAEAIRTRSLAGMAVLAKLITLGGLAMSLSHATAPLSGYEHLVSHLLDLLAETSGRPLAQHGTQVGLATALTTHAYRVFLDEFEPAEVNLEACYPSEAEMQHRVTAVFGALDPTGRVAAECWADYQHKLVGWHRERERFERFLANWPAERAALAERLSTPERVLSILRAVGGPQRFDGLTPAPHPSEVRLAFQQAALIRRRLTLADLFVFTQWDNEALWRRVWEGTFGTAQPAVQG